MCLNKVLYPKSHITLKFEYTYLSKYFSKLNLREKMKKIIFNTSIALVSFVLLSGCGSNNSEKTSSSNNTTTNKINNTYTQNAEAAILYEQCQPCHGQNAERNALGHSSIIANFEKQDILNAINGYRNGTRDIYGFGGLMEGQVDELSDYEVTILSDYIAQF